MQAKFLDFYRIKKNEDAVPFCMKIDEKSGFIFVADGLGGSGGFKHVIEPTDKSIEERLIPAMIPEYAEDERDPAFDGWLERLIAPMTDGIIDTSALWGSRIVIARTAYYCGKYGRESIGDGSGLIDFVYKGMIAVAEEFALQNGESAILPTTLVFVYYRLDGDRLDAEVYWAGDSRAYALVKGEGLKQLSVDDENSAKEITNLFSLGKDKRGTKGLRHRSFRFGASDALFVCSDGLFDIFESEIENIGMETVILDCLENAESFEEFRDKWFGFYQPIAQDDCTVAFVTFADSPDIIKRSLTEKYKDDLRLFETYDKIKKFAPIMDNPELDPEKYIRSRASEKKESIISVICERLFENPAFTDPVVVGRIRELIRSSNAVVAEKAKKEYLARVKNKDNKVFIELLGFFTDDSEFPAPHVTDSIVKGRVKLEALSREKEERFVSFRKAYDEYDRLKKGFVTLIGESKKRVFSEKRGSRALASTATGLVLAINEKKKEYFSAEKELAAAESAYIKSKNKYSAALDELKSVVVRCADRLTKYPEGRFTAEGMEKLFGSFDLKEEIKEVLSESETFGEMIDAFVSSARPSVIDCVFNATKLAVFRDYKTLDRKKMKKFIEEIRIKSKNYII